MAASSAGTVVLVALEDFGAFLAEHADLVSAAMNAIKGGTPKELIVASIRAAQVVASDDAMREELKP